MKTITPLGKKIVATAIFSLISSFIAIVHGIFFDLDFAQIKRITFGGFVLTFILIFICLVILEWIFDVQNHEEFQRMEKRISKLEKRRKK